MKPDPEVPTREEPETKKSWETLFKEAEEAVERAYLAIDDIAGWSGSSGNWPLQEASGRIREARDALRKPEPR